MQFRLFRHEDLAAAHALLARNTHLRESMVAQLPGIWRKWLGFELDTWVVVEDLEHPVDQRMEAFGISMFVAPDFAEAYLSAPHPNLVESLYEAELSGRSPVLDEAGVRAANKPPGLYLVSVCFPTRDGSMATPRGRDALQFGSLAFHAVHGGYRLRSIFGEVRGPDWARAMLGGGFRLLHDFPEVGDLSDAHHPYLFCSDGSAPGTAPLHALPALFAWQPPRFGFSRPQQRLLLRALLGASDAEVAHELGVSLDAIKQSWRAIYSKVDKVAPQLLGVGKVGRQGQRGLFRRRALLEYVRNHQVELRPYQDTRCGG